MTLCITAEALSSECQCETNNASKVESSSHLHFAIASSRSGSDSTKTGEFHLFGKRMEDNGESGGGGDGKGGEPDLGEEGGPGDGGEGELGEEGSRD